MTALGAVSINEGKPLRFWFEIDQLREPTQIAPDGDAPVTEDDKLITRYTTTTTGEQVTLTPIVRYALNAGAASFEFVSSNPTEIGVDAVGNVVYQVPPEQTASATITVTGTNGSAVVARSVLVSLSVSGATSIDVIDGGVVGSARKALSDVVDSALSGANPLTQQDVYTSQDHGTPTYVRNTSFFLNSQVEALTCASPWNSVQGKNRAGTAITKRHAVLANHYNYGAGTTVRFIASDNSVITRTVVQASRILQNGVGTDVWMVLLDSDLPTSITPCKLFPSGYDTYLPAGAAAGSYAATDIPLLSLDQEEKGIILDFSKHGYPQEEAAVLYNAPKLADRLNFYEAIINGDSGNPVFAVIGLELWLLSTFWGSYVGPFYGGLVTELNAMITTLDTLQGDITGHTVTVGDLSSYTTY
tara:strand:- start:2353 stop:3600 length:1248 start_codon:yes stop_codon:yes gene_type:complete